MDTETITMEPVKARVAFEQYRKAVKGRHVIEDEILMRGYKHLSKGKQVLDLVASMKKAGVNGLQQPRLAIARCDWEWCYFNGRRNQFGSRSWLGENETRRKIILPPETFPETVQKIDGIKAKVPIVPAHLKPRGAIGNYHVLWEPDWQNEPPTDPVLLKHLGRYLYAVLAVWDLTPLERALLR